MAASPMSPSEVPIRGLPLQWRLGLSTSVIVTLVLGSLTFFFQRSEVARSRERREGVLAEAAAPLASDIEAAPDVSALRERLGSFEDAHARRGDRHLRAFLRDADGRPAVGRSDDVPREPPPGSFRARLEVVTSLLRGGRGTLEVWQDGQEFEQTVERRWRFWILSIAAAIASLLVSLFVAYHLLIERPLRRLVDGVGQMEKGYWSGLEIPRGAWELRWLAHRFRNLGTQLEETVRRLVEAERRAGPEQPVPRIVAGGDLTAAAGGDAPPAPVGGAHVRRRLLRRTLASRCRFLESQDPKDAGARAAARVSWERDVAEADRLGDDGLKTRLEDAALRILEPAAFEEIRRRLSTLPATNRTWLRKRETEIRKALADGHVRHRALRYRVKNPAGIWRKSHAKGLALDQVQDVVAFRIVVKDEHDCYLALKAIHARFEPLLLRFKDYIAHPKENGYRSLHTCIKAQDGIVFEVQIRTLDMHLQAEAAHWRYKAGDGLPGGGPGGAAEGNSARDVRAPAL